MKTSVMFRFIKQKPLLVLLGVVVLMLLPKLLNAIRNFTNVVETATNAAGEVVDDLVGKQIDSDRKDLIQDLEKKIEATEIAVPLTKSRTAIQGMATRLYEEMQGIFSWVGPLPTPNWGLSDDVYKELQTYSKADLIQLYKDFGVKENKSLKLFSNGSGDLIYWFKVELKDPLFFGFEYLTEMKKIWEKTGLW